MKSLVPPQTNNNNNNPVIWSTWGGIEIGEHQMKNWRVIKLLFGWKKVICLFKTEIYFIMLECKICQRKYWIVGWCDRWAPSPLNLKLFIF